MAGRKRFDVRALYIVVVMMTSFVAALQEDGIPLPASLAGGGLAVASAEPSASCWRPC